jgi:nitric oxide reductase subunit B
LLEWIRFPGDVLFIVGGVLPVLYLSWLAVRHMAPRLTLDQPDEILFTEVVRPQESR